MWDQVQKWLDPTFIGISVGTSVDPQSLQRTDGTYSSNVILSLLICKHMTELASYSLIKRILLEKGVTQKLV